MNRITCEILAREDATAIDLAHIVRTCARDIGQKVTVRTSLLPRHSDSVLTLHLPAELAAAQHPVWCLACRLACFCPGARVSVMVHGETAFRPVAETTPRRLRATA